MSEDNQLIQCLFTEIFFHISIFFLENNTSRNNSFHKIGLHFLFFRHSTIPDTSQRKRHSKINSSYLSTVLLVILFFFWKLYQEGRSFIFRLVTSIEPWCRRTSSFTIDNPRPDSPIFVFLLDGSAL